MSITSAGDSLNIFTTSIIDLERSAPSRLHHLLKGLSDRHKITVLSPFDSWKEKREGTSQYASNFEEIMCRISRVYLPLRKANPALQDIFSPLSVGRMKSLMRDADVHLSYNSMMVGWFASELASRQGIPTVIDIADDVLAMIGESDQIPKPFRGFSRAAGTRLWRSSMALADRVCCASESLVSRFQIPEAKATVVPNGVDTHSFSELTPFEDFLNDGPRVIYVGVVREWVDLDTALLALSSLRKDFGKAQLTVAGTEGNTGRLAELETRYHGLIRQVGPLPYRDVPRAINDSAIGIIPFRKSPTTRGAFPLKALEYAACGRPVVTSTIPELERLFNDVFYFADNSSEIESAIRRILSNPDEARRRVTLGKEIVTEHFQWESIVRQYERVLTTLTER